MTPGNGNSNNINSNNLNKVQGKEKIETNFHSTIDSKHKHEWNNLSFFLSIPPEILSLHFLSWFSLPFYIHSFFSCLIHSLPSFPLRSINFNPIQTPEREKKKSGKLHMYHFLVLSSHQYNWISSDSILSFRKVIAFKCFLSKLCGIYAEMKKKLGSEKVVTNKTVNVVSFANRKTCKLGNM